MKSLPAAAQFLLIFPAFLIGTGLGSLVALGLLGRGGSLDRNVAVIGVCAAGAAVGCALSFLTETWWPPLVGPFVLSIGCSLLAGVLCRKPQRPVD